MKSYLPPKGDVEIRTPETSCVLPAGVNMLRLRFRDIDEARRRAAVLFMLTWDPRKQSFIPFFTFDIMSKVVSLQEGSSADEYDSTGSWTALIRSIPGLASLPSARVVETFHNLQGENAEACENVVDTVETKSGNRIHIEPVRNAESRAELISTASGSSSRTTRCSRAASAGRIASSSSSPVSRAGNATTHSDSGQAKDAFTLGSRGQREAGVSREYPVAEGEDRASRQLVTKVPCCRADH